MISSKEFYRSYFVLNRLHESRAVEKRISVEFVSPSEWRGVLTPARANRLNEAFSRFLVLESLMSESYDPTRNERYAAWREFLKLEVKNNPSAHGLLEDAAAKPSFKEKVKSGFGKAAKFVGDILKAPSRAIAGTRSISRMGKVGKQREEEFKELSEKDLIKNLNAAVSKDFPNNKKLEDFQADVVKVTSTADEYMKGLGEDKAALAGAYEIFNKWLSYQLDQKMGDHYKHFMENFNYKLPMLLEAEEKPEEKPAEKKGDEKKGGGLAGKKGESESLKGLKSNVLPAVLGVLGTIGGFAASYILSANPDLFNPEMVKAIESENVEMIQKQIEAAPSIGDVNISAISARESIAQYATGLKGPEPKSAKDFLSIFSAKGNGDPYAGAKSLFGEIDIKNPDASNSDYVVKRLTQGMDPKKAFFSTGAHNNELERFGGMGGKIKKISGASLAKAAARQLILKPVKTKLISMVAGAGAKTGLASAAAGLGAAAAAGILSALAVKALRVKGLKSSRAQVLNNLYREIGTYTEPESAPVQPATPDGGGGGGGGGTPTSPSPGDEGGGGGGAPPSTDPGVPTTTTGTEEEIGDEEEVKCTPEQLKAKVLDFLKTRKGIKADKQQVVADKLAAAMLTPDFQPETVEDIEASIKGISGLKKLKAATVAGLANAVKDCFFESGEEDIEDEEEGGTPGPAPAPGPGTEETPAEPEKEVKKIEAGTQEDIATRAFDDQASYFEPEKPGFEDDQKYNAFVRNANTENSTDESNAIAAGNYKRTYQEKLSKADFRKLVRLLSDMGKLDDNEINFEDEEIRNDLSTTTNKQFKKSLPGQYMARARKLSNDPQVQDLLRGNDLPLMLLAKRRALAEAIALILRRSAQVLTEQRRLRSDKIVLERWQRMAGLLKG